VNRGGRRDEERQCLRLDGGAGGADAGCDVTAPAAAEWECLELVAVGPPVVE